MPLLSLRGVIVLLAGVIAAGGGALLGEPDLVAFGVLLATLPLISLLFLWLATPAIEVERSPKPGQAAIGSGVEVVLRLSNGKALTAGSLEFTDLAPAPIGGGAQFRVARAFGRWQQAVSYRIDTTQRGQFLIGPLTVRFSDPWASAAAPSSRRVSSHGFG